ncbi:hypothetical protein R1flu_004458 [Riccia fluitans]|uniref:PGG domain-containing protein n=1 Tax=Riccia fluitans TaxID=41844 RepID=A0ABD1YT97_9MARC
MSTGEPPPTTTRDEQITALYKIARYYSTTPNISIDETIEEKDRSTEAQRKRVYRWLLNHARIGQVDLLEKFLQAPEETRKHVLDLKDEYVRKDQTNNPDQSKDVFEKNGFSVLHVAALFGQPAVVEKVLPNGEDKFGFLMERTHPYGWLALHLCTRVDVHTSGPGYRVVKLLLAAFYGEYTRIDTQEAQMTVSTFKIRFQEKFHDKMTGMTPLHYAARTCNQIVVRELLGKNYLGRITFVHSVDLFLLTPLHISALVLEEGQSGSLVDAPVKDALMIAQQLLEAAGVEKTSSVIAAGNSLNPVQRAAIMVSEAARVLMEAAGAGNPQAIGTSRKVVVEDSMLDICINALDCCSYTPLHWAARSDAVEIIKLLLEQDKIKTLEKDRMRKTPLHVAMECSRHATADDNFSRSTSSKKLLMANSVVREDVHRRLNDRQIIVDSSNAKLVGASLVASVTFASLLQPPLGWVPYYDEKYKDSPDNRVYTAVGKDTLIEVFWAFNCLSFLFAICTVICSSTIAVRPNSRVHIRDIVASSKIWLKFTSFLFTVSLIFVLGAFFLAGIAVLPPSTLVRVETFIVPAVIPMFISVILCLYHLRQFCYQFASAARKKWKTFHTHTGQLGFGVQNQSTREARQASRGLKQLVRLLTRSSDRFKISEIRTEIEGLRESYHRHQSPESCRKEAIQVGEDALNAMKEIYQTPQDTWDREAL